MKIRTDTLTDAALDWAVAKCEGYTGVALQERTKTDWYSPSTDWAQGGPIIEREGIRLHRSLTGNWWAGSEAEPSRPLEGPTPLIAAMRAYAASKLGDEIDVPEGLK